MGVVGLVKGGKWERSKFTGVSIVGKTLAVHGLRQGARSCRGMAQGLSQDNGLRFAGGLSQGGLVGAPAGSPACPSSARRLPSLGFGKVSMPFLKKG